MALVEPRPGRGLYSLAADADEQAKGCDGLKAGEWVVDPADRVDSIECLATRRVRCDRHEHGGTNIRSFASSPSGGLEAGSA